MKNILSIIIVLLLLSLLSCGKDGAEGRAYISFDWDYTVLYYNDSNPSVPYSIWRNQNYESSAGTFYFEYGSQKQDVQRIWTGSYTITKNPGEKGSFLVDGKDGANKYFKIYLGFSGPRISVNKPTNIIENQNSELFVTNRKTIKNPIEMSNYDIQEVKDGNITITLHYKLKDNR